MKSSEPLSPFFIFKGILENIKEGHRECIERAKSLFTSDADYYIFKRAIASDIHKVVYDLSDLGNPYTLVEGSYSIIVGVNDDGKLFCNIVDVDPSLFVTHGTFSHEEVLGYDVDSTYINGSGSFRVQGDLVFRVEAYEEVRAYRLYYDNMMDTICNAIRHRVKNHIMAEALRYLGKLGLSCDMGIDYLLIHSEESFHEVRDYLLKELNRLVRKISNKYGGKAWVTSPMLSESLDFSFYYTEDTNKLHKIYHKVVDEVVRELLTEREERVIIAGNHTIRVNSYPTTASIELPDFLFGGHISVFPVFVSNAREGFITREEVTIEHEEHGATVVKFDPQFIYYVEPAFTNVSVWDSTIRNSYVLRKLREEIMSE